MKRIIKSLILTLAIAYLPASAIELDVSAGKFGTISKDDSVNEIQLEKLNKGCSAYMSNAIRVKKSNYGIFGRYKIFGYTNTYWCGRPHRSLIYTRLYYKLGSYRQLCAKGKNNTTYQKASCSYRWLKDRPYGAAAVFAARVNGQELRKTLYGR